MATYDPEFQARLRATFQAEAAEHLRALSQEAFALEKAATAAEHQTIVERMFRETHTLKGAARMVGEFPAEALCQVFEQQLSELKQTKAAVPPATVAAIHQRVSAIAESLAASVAPASETAAPVAAATAPSVSTGALVRVATSRLDALLARSEELIGAKLTGAQRATTLHELSDRARTWKKDWERMRSDLSALRRFIDSGADTPISKELRALVQYVDHTHEFMRAWQRDAARLSLATAADQRRLGAMVDLLLEDAKDVLMQPFSSLLESFPAFVRETALAHGKEIELHVLGGTIETDRRVLEEMKDVIVHLVRNAIDHGIEPAVERRAGGKRERAQLTIAVEERGGGYVEILVRDDGRGIDAARIAATARTKGLVSDDTELADHEALTLLFSSGFSTKETVTDLSGRGLGLAIVREKAGQIGGSVEVETKRGQGTTFRLRLPITLARFRGVFVQAGGQSFVVPASHVVRTLRLRGSALKQVKNQTVIELDDGAITVLSLAEILGCIETATTRRSGEAMEFVLLVQSGRSRVGLRIDAPPLEQEVVMKGLGKMLRKARHYVGATIVGGGEIVPVLNLSELLGAAVRRERAPASAPAARPRADIRQRKILIAEDSITSRSLLKNILQTAGFEVRTAVDGADAMTILKFEPVDLLISDVQMPRLDGFELTARIRANKSLSTLPVILITSLASSEDKARGVDAGANAYIVKSSFDQSDLLTAIGRLLS